MQIDDRVFNLAMTEQHLDGAQISAGFEQVRSVTVPQRVRRDMLPNPSALRCQLASLPRNLGGDGNVRSPVLHRAGKQIVLRLHPAPVDTERLQKLFAQRNIAIVTAFPLPDVNHHPLAVDIGDLKTAQFRAADTRRVQGHEHRAVEEVTGRVDELRYFLRAQDLRKFAVPFGSRNIFEQIPSLQSLDIEEAKRGHMLLHGTGVQLLLLKQVGLILTQVLRTELVGSLMEMAGKFLDDPKVGFYGTLSVVTALEFLQHHSAKMGHKDLLVTHNLSPVRQSHLCSPHAQRPPRQRLGSNALAFIDFRRSPSPQTEF